MAVNSKKITSGPYNGNGVADTFSYTFRITDKTEVSVYETDDVGVETLLTVDSDYTVNDIGNNNGGTIVRKAGALPLNYQWFIRSNYEETQQTSFNSQGAFFPDLHEDAMDKLTFLIQQLLDKNDRTISVSDTYTGELPLSIDNPVAGLALQWRADLLGLENVDFNPVFINVTGDTMTGTLGGVNATASDHFMPQLQTTETIDERMSSAPEFDPNNFQDYGLVTQAVGDSNDYGSI